MKKNILYLALALALPIISSCSSSDDLRDSYSETRTVSLPGGIQALAGRMHIKVSPEAVRKMKPGTSGVISMQSAPTRLSRAMNDIGTYRIERLFAPAGQFEERSIAFGLDRWFTIHFDSRQDLTVALKKFQSLDEVQVAEEVACLSFPETTTAAVPAEPLKAKGPASAPFNDPQIGAQWHYKNDGSIDSRSRAGSDCNVWPVWKDYTTGKPNVIVAIIDGGIDVTHEDLKDNLHVNTAELNGTQGVDDDGNGFVDDVYGYNFVEASDVVGGKIEPDDAGHGTHVAGTVAARNNNGLGVAGIAGGDGSTNSGVRLLSCQIFRKSKEEGSAEAAIKYAADNGAVIAQCSWGYASKENVKELPKSLKEAIDYFITFAGCDAHGAQRSDSPMKGGVMIFAAGNENMNFKEFPAAYEKVISVASTAWNFQKASYSNYADWVSISAPGGDQDAFGLKAGVLSTMPKKIASSGYGYMQGTSMACPHVSGIAGLVVSYFGKQGFTADMLKERIVSSFLPYNIDELNPSYKGKLGTGFIDAYAAFAQDQGIAPQKVENIEISPSYSSVSLKWKAVSDADDKTAAFYNIYISDAPITTASLASMEAQRVNGIGYSVGGTINHNFEYLRDNTNYYFAIVAIDRWGHESPAAFAEGKTKLNHAPSIEGTPAETVTVGSDAKKSFEFTIQDADGHEWTYALRGDTKGVSTRKIDEKKVEVTIWPILSAGDYEFTVVATDEYGARSEKNVKFRIVKYVPPTLIEPFNDIILGMDMQNHVVKVSTHYNMSNPAVASYSAVSSNPAVAVVEPSAASGGGTFSIRALSKGTSRITVSVTDGQNTSQNSFQVRVVQRESDPVYMIYPIPVQTNLNALLNSRLKQAEFVINSQTGEEVMRARVKTNNKNVATIDISRLSPGTYRLSVNTEIGNYKQVFIKR